MADGKVDADEYEQAYWNLRRCLEGRGYSVSDPMQSPLTGSTLEFVYEDNGRSHDVAFADYEDCEGQFWTPVSDIYRATAPQEMEESLKQAIADCLLVQGEKVDASARSYAELLGGSPSGALIEKANNCAQDSAFRLYPDLPSLSIVL